jgi:hypothetical protein
MGLLPTIFEIATGYWASQAVYVAEKLGIADLLAEGPKSSEEIARATGANGNAIYRLLRALASLGVLAHEHHRFHLTEIGIPLRSGVPGSLRSMLLTFGEEHYAWGRLLDSVTSGEPAFNRVYNAPLFEYFQSNTAAGETFNDAMNDFTCQAALANSNPGLGKCDRRRTLRIWSLKHVSVNSTQYGIRFDLCRRWMRGYLVDIRRVAIAS